MIGSDALPGGEQLWWITQRQFMTKIRRQKPRCFRSPQTRTSLEKPFPDTSSGENKLHSDGPPREPQNPPGRAPAFSRERQRPAIAPHARSRGTGAGGSAAPRRLLSVPGGRAVPRLVTCSVNPFVSPPPPAGAAEARAQPGVSASGMSRAARTRTRTRAGWRRAPGSRLARGGCSRAAAKHRMPSTAPQTAAGASEPRAPLLARQYYC
ncbi:uncharacterized protein ACIB01_007141 [Guaruba guarouba]